MCEMVKKQFVLAIIVGLLLLAAPSGSAHADAGRLPLPPGFSLLRSAPGVELYKKDYPNGSPDFVQVINLESGASIKLLHGPVVEPRPKKGVYGGADPRLGMKSLGSYWRETKAYDDNTFCVTNGSFFYMPESPTRLAFPLKVDGQVLTDGFAIQQHPDQKLMLELWADRADIIPLSQEALYGSSAPNIIAGLEEDANKRIKSSVGRTFVGIVDQDGDRAYETILLLNTETAYQSAAAEVLRAFGAAKVMMLDGGGSTQLICQGQDYVASERLIPQAIAVLAAPPSPVSANSAEPSIWLVSVEEETMEMDFELTNTGTQAWKPGEHQFVLEKSPLSAKQTLPFESVVAPGERAAFSLKLSAYSKAGLYSVQLEWHIAYNGEEYPGDPITLRIVVLPVSLNEKRSELSALIQDASTQSEDEIERQVQTWLEQNGESSLPQSAQPATPLQINLQDLIWIPLIMLPFILVVMAYIEQMQRQ